MKRIVVMGHGGYAEGIRQNLEMIIGPQENMHFADLTKDDDLSDYEQRINDLIAEFEPDDEILFACDLLGASPFRVAAMLSANSDGKYCVAAGLNTMAFIEASMKLTEDITITELAKLSIQTAKDAIVIFPEQ